MENIKINLMVNVRYTYSKIVNEHLMYSVDKFLNKNENTN